MTTIDQLRELPVSERIQLVEDLWDTIAEAPEDLILTDAQKAELDRRLDRLDESPEQGTEWATLKTRIVNSL